MTGRILQKAIRQVRVTGGLVAGMVVQRVWKRVIGEEDAPEATDANRGWGKIILAAAIQGAIFAVVKAIVDRGGATGSAGSPANGPGT